MNTLLELLDFHFVLRNALYASLLIGLAAPPLGAFVVLGRRTLLALTLPQASTLGVALAVWLGSALGFRMSSLEHSGAFLLWALLGSTLAMGAFGALMTRIERRNRTPLDADAGALYAFATAMTLALAAGRYIPELGLLDRLKGEILAVPTTLLLCQAGGSAVLLSILIILAKPLECELFNPVLCHAAGLPSGWLRMVTVLLIGALIALGGLCAGPLTIFAFLVLPPLTALPFVRSMTQLYIGAALLGVLGAFLGFWASYAWESWNLPVAASQIVVLGIAWAFSRVARG